MKAQVKRWVRRLSLGLAGLGPIVLAGFVVLSVSHAQPQPTARSGGTPGPPSSVPGTATERHLANMRQLTFGGQNAEAYFSFDGARLIFQSTNNWSHDVGATAHKAGGPELGCYQMYVMDLDDGHIRLVSTGAGATTCGYFFPGDRRVLYSSTHMNGVACPPKPARTARYRWALDD
ncbi:MAG: TolB family protein, partial [Nitrospirales bacterium]